MISTSPYPKPLFVMAMPVTPFESYAHALKCAADSIAYERKSFCVAINADKIYRATRLAQDASLRAVMGGRAREFYQQDFGRDRRVARIVQAIEGLRDRLGCSGKPCASSERRNC